ncbi:MAG TPA: hypothetical protein VIT38_14060 [Allosphingosinicella sp.]
MAEWRFPALDDGLVEQEPTQRDQFNNDEVELAAALVRETIQNSTDAPNGAGPVKVRFAIHELRAKRAGLLGDLFTTLEPHLEACGIGIDPLLDDPAGVLVIEDFNTCGLTGATDKLDEGNFRNFWRRHGKSGKAGKAGGRWGLGKLVYSSASRISCFFGLTIRDGDSARLLMGQAVLGTHKFGGERRPPHGFWYNQATQKGLQLPIEDPSLIDPFVQLTGIVRTAESGLSLVIPYPHASITEESLIAGVVANYYFPILAGRLEVEVGDTVIDRESFLDVAQNVSKAAIPFGFVAAVSERLEEEPDAEGVLPVNIYEVTEAQFPEMLEPLRNRLAAGELVHVRLHVEVTPRKGDKAGQNQTSPFDVFLQNPPPGSDPFALFVRGSLTVPGEIRSFRGVAAWGAMVAAAGPVAAFLGDAENPAHTLWNATAEKLTANWHNPAMALRNVRNAPKQLQQLLGEQVEQHDPDALIDFFSLVDDTPTGDAKKKRRTRKKPIEIMPRERGLEVQARNGGFAIVAGTAAQKWAYPAQLRIRAAYDIIGADPFKRWSPFDFEMDDKELELTLSGASLVSSKGNILRVSVSSPDFRIEAGGFDPNRDILVEARNV